MASSAPHFALSPFLSLSKNTIRRRQNFHPLITTTSTSLKIRASGGELDLLGDFGARDPFPAEIESRFCEKVLGNVSTEHKILIPNASALSLAQLQCYPVSQLQLLSEDETKKLLYKVVGWRIVEEEGGLKLEGSWKVRDEKCGEELMNRIRDAVESTGHVPTLQFEAPNQVRAQLWTSSLGGLSINDFIVAAKVDGINVSDLQPRLRVWA
ncbi:hypothetical protein ACS0TY_001181 [Phlomoides rotata]